MVQGRATGLSISKLVADQLEEVEQVFLQKIANVIIDESPIWAGPYIENHTIEDRSAQGQFTGNLNGWNKEAINKGSIRESARQNLLATVASIPPGSTAFVNRTPHAWTVEYGGAQGRVVPHMVYHRAREMAPRLLQEAISEVGR